MKIGWPLVVSYLLSGLTFVEGGDIDDVQLLMYETDVTLKSILAVQAANIPGITASVIGQGTVFEGFGSKYEAVLPVLRSFDPDTLVVLSDARDVIINEPANRQYNTMDMNYISAAVQDFRDRFDQVTANYPGAIVLSAEAQCCVGALTYAKLGDYFNADGTRKNRACYSGHSPCLWNGDDKAIPWQNFMLDLALERMGIGDDVYLNAGMIAGRAGDILRVFEMADFHVFEDDQAVLTDLMFVRPEEIILDYNQAIFGNNRHSSSGCMFQDVTEEQRLLHAETGTTPLFIHSPGGFISCHEGLAAKLGVQLGGAEERKKLQAWKLTMNEKKDSS